MSSILNGLDTITGNYCSVKHILLVLNILNDTMYMSNKVKWTEMEACLCLIPTIDAFSVLIHVLLSYNRLCC